MAAKYADISIFVNNVNRTSILKDFIINISLIDSFDSDFTLSQLKINISSQCNFTWNYRDKIKLEIFWSDKNTLKLITGNFYIDYIIDEKTPANYGYSINATEANLDQGFVVGEKIKLTNTTIDTALTDFATLYGLTLTKIVDPNTILGSVDVPDPYGGGAVPGASTIEIEFNSYADMLRYISQNYGYFGNLSGTTLQMIRPESPESFDSDFPLPNLQDIFSFRGEFKYTDMSKDYKIYYLDGSDILQIGVLTNDLPIVTGQVNFIDESVAYADISSATARVYGEYRKDFIDGYKIRLHLNGDYRYKAGANFFLPLSFGEQYTGYYRTTKVTHDIINEQWTTEIEAFLLDSFNRTSTSFNGEYAPITGDIDLTITELISSANPITITPANINDYISEFNPGFITVNPNTGSQVLTRSTIDGIRTDILLALALVETNNFTFTNLTDNFNPGGIGDALGINIYDFGNWDTGWLGTTQHLFAYANTTGNPNDPIVDPRFSFVTRGSATTVTALDGKWSTQNGYSSSIKQQMLNFYRFLGYNPAF